MALIRQHTCSWTTSDGTRTTDRSMRTAEQRRACWTSPSLKTPISDTCCRAPAPSCAGPESSEDLKVHGDNAVMGIQIDTVTDASRASRQEPSSASHCMSAILVLCRLISPPSQPSAQPAGSFPAFCSEVGPASMPSWRTWVASESSVCEVPALRSPCY